MSEHPLHIISLGAGVQSTAMALMASCGELSPEVNSAIFADTKDEPKKVYDHLGWLKSVLNFSIHVVEKGDLMADNIRVIRSKKSGKLYMNGKIPAFTLSPSGKVGLLGRRCTPDFKIEPIHRKSRDLIGKDGYLDWRKRHKTDLKEWAIQIEKRKSKDSSYSMAAEMELFRRMQEDALVVMWIGISTDEADRSKPSQKPWLRNTWPLLDANMSREQCENWIKSHGFPPAPKSACKKCPFHSDEEWAKQTSEEFLESVQYEKEMQLAAARQEVMDGVPYLHSSCVPLDKVDFKKAPGYQQLSGFSNECEGLCGV